MSEPIRLIRLPETLARTGQSRSSFYEAMARGEFVPVKIGRRAIAFPEHEIDQWIQARLAERGAVQ